MNADGAQAKMNAVAEKHIRTGWKGEAVLLRYCHANDTTIRDLIQKFVVRVFENSTTFVGTQTTDVEATMEGWSWQWWTETRGVRKGVKLKWGYGASSRLPIRYCSRCTAKVPTCRRDCFCCITTRMSISHEIEQWVCFRCKTIPEQPGDTCRKCNGLGAFGRVWGVCGSDWLCKLCGCVSNSREKRCTGCATSRSHAMVIVDG